MIQLKSDKTWSQLYSFELISFGRQMATFADNSVANFFFTRHGDQNGRSLERCSQTFISPFLARLLIYLLLYYWYKCLGFPTHDNTSRADTVQWFNCIEFPVDLRKGHNKASSYELVRTQLETFGHHFPLFAQSLGVQWRQVESIRIFLFVMALLCPSKISFARFKMYCPL